MLVVPWHHNWDQPGMQGCDDIRLQQQFRQGVATWQGGLQWGGSAAYNWSCLGKARKQQQ